MERKLIDVDAEGVRTFLCRDAEARVMWYEYEEPVQVILNQNMESQANFSKTSALGDAVVVAELPDTAAPTH